MNLKPDTFAFAIGTLTCSLLAAGSAQAALIAGWDFSQYFAPNTLSTDGAVFTDTLDANYSDLDPTFGAGAESAAFGTMHMDGSNGSTDVDESSSTAAFVPTGGSLASNLGAPGSVPFDSHPVLDAEDQTFTKFLSMTATEAVSIVFEADLSVLTAFNGWSVSFAGATFAGTTTVAIDFSTDGVGYAEYATVALDATDTLFSVDLGIARTDNVFVRFRFDAPVGSDQGIIDNVAIRAEEVATVPTLPHLGTVLLAAMLVFSGRRHLRGWRLLLRGPGVDRGSIE